MSDIEKRTIPLETHESWRTWLMTGARRTPVDRRRLRGANRGLKKILLEGLTGNSLNVDRWQDFSGAMVRHAVEDAMRSLPPEDTRVLKLAYFGGYSNREIALEVGMTEGTVQRRLRRALESISDQIQRGQALGRRAVYGLALFLSGRWVGDAASHAWTVTAVAAAAVVIAAAPPLPGAVHQPAMPAAHRAARSGPVVAPVQSPAAPVQAVEQLSGASVTVPAVQVPTVKLPLPILARIKHLL